MNLSVGGKALKHPNTQLSKSNLTSHSMVTCEYNLPLDGGMKKSSDKVQDPPTGESNKKKIAAENED